MLTGLLVTELGINGLIMTDDLDMGAIINETGFGEMMDRAMRAGNHLAMICHRVHLVEDALTALHTVDSAALDRALAGVDRFKRKMTPPYPFSEEQFRALDQKIWDL